jgi:formylglycine-generating enzyme required for sulfatase activity
METFKIFQDIDFSKMQPIKGGSFMMGSNDGNNDEKPIHQVTVKDFYIGKYPVIQALWQKVMDNNPSYFKGRNRPVECISWDDITEEFLPKLNEQTNLSGKFRLPTEAEWEYAAKRNQNTEYVGSNNLEEVGWYDENSHYETKPAGLKNPNDLDLYDMSGNVLEWCEDVWHYNYINAPNDGTAWLDDVDDKKIYYVLRGDYILHKNIRFSTYRNYSTSTGYSSSIGFRLAFQIQ